MPDSSFFLSNSSMSFWLGCQLCPSTIYAPGCIQKLMWTYFHIPHQNYQGSRQKLGRIKFFWNWMFFLLHQSVIKNQLPSTKCEPKYCCCCHNLKWEETAWPDLFSIGTATKKSADTWCSVVDFYSWADTTKETKVSKVKVE